MRFEHGVAFGTVRDREIGTEQVGTHFGILLSSSQRIDEKTWSLRADARRKSLNTIILKSACRKPDQSLTEPRRLGLSSPVESRNPCLPPLPQAQSSVSRNLS